MHILNQFRKLKIVHLHLLAAGNPLPANHNYCRFTPFYLPIISLLLGMKWRFKQLEAVDRGSET